MQLLGNWEIQKEIKTAFFCSRKYPVGIILKSFDWANEQVDNRNCIISGFHTPIEKDVLKILLKGRQSITICPARNIDGVRIPPDQKAAFAEGRILYMSEFEGCSKRISRELSLLRNEMILRLAERIVVAYAHPGGQLEHTLISAIQTGSKVSCFNIPENEHLFKAGALAV